MLENAQAEIAEGERREVRIERADEVFVEPLCFFDLKAYSLHRFQFFLWQIDYEAYTEIIQPCKINMSKPAKDEVTPSSSYYGDRERCRKHRDEQPGPGVATYSLLTASLSLSWCM